MGTKKRLIYFAVIVLVGAFGFMAVAQDEEKAATVPAAKEAATSTVNYVPVTDERLLNPEPENWLIYKGNYSQQAYSQLDQIDASNVSDLQPVWAFSTGVTAGHEGPPLVNNGIMFATGAYNTLFALDSKTGNQLWAYKRDLPQDVYPLVCCGVVNRGVALYGNNVYMATLDAHLLAFDAATGKMVWDSEVADYTEGYTMTLAPLAVKDKILVGVSGGEYGIRGFVEAFNAETGESVWKTYTTASPDQAGGQTWPADTYENGGGSVWVTGSYDPDTNLSYWGTGNGGPWMGQVRNPPGVTLSDADSSVLGKQVKAGDNLYVSSVIALDVDTGEIVSFYQYNPNDSWDLDAISDQTLVTVTRDGQEVKGLLHAGRNGWFYMLDRANNLEFIYAIPHSRISELGDGTVTGVDTAGRPIVPEDRIPAINKTIEQCPDTDGASNWYGLSFNPDLGYAFVPTTEWCSMFTGHQTVYQAGQSYTGAKQQKVVPDAVASGKITTTGSLSAIDVATGEIAWRVEQQLPMRSPTLTTKGGLVFIGDLASREFRAYDAKTGDELWRFKTNSGVIGVPTTYEVDGVQYVAVESGSRDLTYTMSAEAAFFNTPYTITQGGVIWVFALPQQQTSSQ